MTYDVTQHQCGKCTRYTVATDNPDYRRCLECGAFWDWRVPGLHVRVQLQTTKNRSVFVSPRFKASLKSVDGRSFGDTQNHASEVLAFKAALKLAKKRRYFVVNYDAVVGRIRREALLWRR